MNFNNVWRRIGRFFERRYQALKEGRRFANLNSPLSRYFLSVFMVCRVHYDDSCLPRFPQKLFKVSIWRHILRAENISTYPPNDGRLIALIWCGNIGEV